MSAVTMHPRVSAVGADLVGLENHLMADTDQRRSMCLVRIYIWLSADAGCGCSMGPVVMVPHQERTTQIWIWRKLQV